MARDRRTTTLWPHTSRTWSELAFFLLSSALAVAALAFVSFTMACGLVLAITFFGLAVLALWLQGGRGIGGERGLVRSLLGEPVLDPPPFVGRPRRPAVQAWYSSRR